MFGFLGEIKTFYCNCSCVFVLKSQLVISYYTCVCLCKYFTNNEWKTKVCYAWFAPKNGVSEKIKHLWRGESAVNITPVYDIGLTTVMILRKIPIKLKAISSNCRILMAT